MCEGDWVARWVTGRSEVDTVRVRLAAGRVLFEGWRSGRRWGCFTIH